VLAYPVALFIARLPPRAQSLVILAYISPWLVNTVVKALGWTLLLRTNGVVNTLVKLVRSLESKGTEVLVVAPDGHRTLPLPSYPEIRVAWDPWKAVPRIRGLGFIGILVSGSHHQAHHLAMAKGELSHAH